MSFWLRTELDKHPYDSRPRRYEGEKCVGSPQLTNFHYFPDEGFQDGRRRDLNNQREGVGVTFPVLEAQSQYQGCFFQVKPVLGVKAEALTSFRKVCKNANFVVKLFDQCHHKVSSLIVVVKGN